MYSFFKIKNEKRNVHSEISRRFTVKLFTLGIRVMKEVSGPDVHAAEIKDISETFVWKNSHSVLVKGYVWVKCAGGRTLATQLHIMI